MDRESKVEGRGSKAHGFRFEKLDVWHAARGFNRSIYPCTKDFPSSEQFALTSQLRRAAISISSNIAEGSGRNSGKDFAHFLEQAYASTMEVASQLFLAFGEGYLNQAALDERLEEARALAAQIAALNRSLLVRESKVRWRLGSAPSTLVSRPSTSS